MNIEQRDYWENATPMNFVDERWTYEQKREFRYSLQDYMHDAIDFDAWRGKRVLEFGCGSGIDAVEFAHNGAEVTAVDVTENACRLTKALAAEAGVRIDVVQTDSTLPFDDNTFDLVYSFGVLHHIPDVENTLAEVHRVLKPKGKVIAMVYNKDSLLYAYSIVHLHKSEDLSEEELTRKYSERIKDCPYTKVYTKNEARELFEQCFADVKIIARYNVIDTPLQRKTKLDIDDKYELGWHLIVQGRKE